MAEDLGSGGGSGGVQWRRGHTRREDVRSEEEQIERRQCLRAVERAQAEIAVDGQDEIAVAVERVKSRVDGRD